MAFSPHYRLSMSGLLGSNNGEAFTFTLSLHKTVPTVAQPDNDQFDDIVDDVSAFFARPATHISSLTHLTQVKLARIGSDGKYEADPWIADVNVAGGGGQDQIYPPQVALAVSFDTETRGAKGRGRFYLPTPALPLQADYTVSAAYVTQVRDSVKQFIDDLNNEPNVDVLHLRACVASKTGTNSDITGVRVGRVLDTIRSRRRSLPEGYTADAQIA